MPSTVNGAGTEVIVAGAHGHGGRDDVLSPFLWRVPVENILATGNDASVPEVLTRRGDFNLKGHAVDGVNVVIGVTLGQNTDVISSLNNIRTEDLRSLDHWNSVVVNTDLLDVVAVGHVSGDADQSCTKVG